MHSTWLEKIWLEPPQEVLIKGSTIMSFSKHSPLKMQRPISFVCVTIVIGIVICGKNLKGRTVKWGLSS